MNGYSIKQRLTALRAEYDKGQDRLRDLHRQEVEVRETLLRIEGAMAILGELMKHATPGGDISGSLNLDLPDGNDWESLPVQSPH